MCQRATWKNVCPGCEKRHRRERKRKIERGWCHYAVGINVFGSCGDVDELTVNYAGKLSAFASRHSLDSEDWAYVELQMS